MRALGAATLGWILLAVCEPVTGQADFRVYHDHPRLFLEPARLERLRKDVDRQSLRWQALRAMVDSGTTFPEQPLADGLVYQVEGTQAAGKRAAQWGARVAESGVQTAADLRQAALVYDWCREALGESTRPALRDAIAAAVSEVLPRAGIEVGLVRAAILGAISLAGDWDGSEAALQSLLETHWNQEVQPELEMGRLTDDGAALVAVLEASLAVRHNLEIDLLRPATDALAGLVRTRLLSYYPVDLAAPGGPARRPSLFGTDEGAARAQAPLYRLAEMLLVGYESNLQEFQFLQGWVRDDRYRMASPAYAPYEFLWVNPYLPGLTPLSAPMLAYDPVRGRLYGRLGWEPDATWIGYAGGRLEILGLDGLSAADSLADLPPMYFPDAVVVPLEPPARVVLRWQPADTTPPETARIVLIGLKPLETYAVKLGGRHAKLIEAGAGGVIVLRADSGDSKRDRIDLRKKVRVEVRPTLKPASPSRPRPTLLR